MARKESRGAMLKRLKAQRKKAKIGEFAPKKKTKSRSINRRVSVPKRRKSMPRRKKSSSRKRGFLGNLGTPVKRGIILGLGQPIVDKVFQAVGVNSADNMVQLLGSVVLSSVVPNRTVKDYANINIAIQTAELTKQMVGKINLGGLGGVFNSSSSTETPVTTQEVIIG